MHRGPALGIVQPMSSPNLDVPVRLATLHGSFGSSVQKRTEAFLSSLDDNDVLLMAPGTKCLRISIFLFFYSRLSFRIFCEHSSRYNFK